MPNLIKRGGVWHYSFNVERERFRFSARTADKELAADIAIKHELRQRRAAVHGPESVTTFSEAVGLYLDAGKDSRYVLKALDWFRDTRLAAITPPMVREAAQKLYPGTGPATLNRQGIAPIQAIINHAADKGLCPRLYVRRFPVEKVNRPAGSKAWLAAFQEAARGLGNERIAAMARFMFETGARIGQALELTWDDLRLAEGFAVLRTGKTGRGGPKRSERRAWMTPAMVSEIANLSTRHPIKVFGYASRRTIYRAWAAAVEHARIEPLTTHEAGRHGFGTEMVVRNGIDVATAAEAGGWKSKRLMLDTYVSGNTERDVINRVFGKPRTQRKRKA
jgi:integrase